MSATRVPISELRPRRASPLVGMGVHLALLQDSLDRFRDCWEEFMTSPFPTAEAAEDSKDYAADEDDWPVAAGEE